MTEVDNQLEMPDYEEDEFLIVHTIDAKSYIGRFDSRAKDKIIMRDLMEFGIQVNPSTGSMSIGVAPIDFCDGPLPVAALIPAMDYPTRTLPAKIQERLDQRMEDVYRTAKASEAGLIIPRSQPIGK